jgi:hypothetical protein
MVCWFISQVNSYPTDRGFTAIGTGGDDFVQSMVVAVESVLQESIPKVSTYSCWGRKKNVLTWILDCYLFFIFPLIVSCIVFSSHAFGNGLHRAGYLRNYLLGGNMFL